MSEQFLTIPHLSTPWQERVALREKIRLLSTWAPSVDIEHDAGRRELAVMVRVSAATIKYAKDESMIAKIIGDQVRCEFQSYLENLGFKNQPTRRY